MFGTFILLCGTTHVMNLWTVWHGTYRLEGLVKLLTAAVSITTAVALWPLIPTLIALPSSSQLERANRELQAHIVERQQAEEALRKAHDELEMRVAARTEELLMANAALEDKAAELEEANAHLAQYAYAVSHDLKTPLRGIHHYADFLREDLETSLDDEHQAYLEGLCRAVWQAEALVDGLLELSRVGSRNLVYQAVNLNTLLQEIITALSLPEEVDILWQGIWPTTEYLAVEALKAGVDDYIIKDASQGYIDLLPLVLPEVVQRYRDRLEHQRAQNTLSERESQLRLVTDALPVGSFYVYI